MTLPSTAEVSLPRPACPICDDTLVIVRPWMVGADRHMGKKRGAPCARCCPGDFEAAMARADQRDLEGILARAGVPRKFQGVTLEAFVEDPDALVAAGLSALDASRRGAWKAGLRAYLGDLEGNLDAGVGMTLTGSVGVGKTLCLCILAAEMVKRRVSVIVVPERSTFDAVKATWDHDDGVSEGDVLGKFGGVRVLMIDDFGVRKPTEWVTDIYHSIIDARWDAGLATFVSSNVPISELYQVYPRQMDRLKKNVSLEMVGGSLRGTELER